MKQKHTNRLIHENSPYLLQHAHNPVNWYPWGEEALAKAKKENKVILVSIGYAACHWCHVMESESFENEETAKVMNDFFVCIKVDREERPDIDQVYMDAVQLMTGRGGWPLNCFLMPNGKPFFGGTYFRPDDWVKVLRGIQNAWLNDTDKVKSVADQIAQGIHANELITDKSEQTNFHLDDLKKGVNQWKTDFDTKEGGNNRAPKFPLPNGLQFLLHYYFFTQDKSALDHVSLTLDKMAKGGIYDQVGGGFARYSVDAIWKVPHFEKMLYDNAQLVSLYSEAYQLTKNPEYKSVVDQTLAFVDRELSLPEGGFYSSLDADSDGVEGKFYVWQKSEVDALLGADSKLFCEYYGITSQANWEQGNILMVQSYKQKLAMKYGLSVKEFDRKIKKGKQLLLDKRKHRIRPALDDKVLTSWNALMLKGYVDAYKAFGEEKYLQRAIKNAEFLQKYIWKGKGHLHRNYKDGISKINGFLDDYSFTIEAFVALYQATFDEKWLIASEDLIEHVLQHFSDDKSGMFFYTSDEDPALIARKMELLDNVIPGSNSSIAKDLFLLGTYLDKQDYIDRSAQMLGNVKERMSKVLSYHSNWAQLMFWFTNPLYEIVVVGDKAMASKKKIEAKFLPNALIAGSTKASNMPLLQNRYVNGQTTFYLCRNKTCKLPVTKVADLFNQLNIEMKEGK
ncbi:thioredoxin domain-containing protein [Ancylomarina longa]|uniref:Thioredoxin domain-containing protein n=2 Tax=Ancylomarina longa TaxID=2487017 RepID=A0A434AVA8_9BACT|nr:thioredoxin domain-containing protein [Ancylomarina longa]